MSDNRGLATVDISLSRPDRAIRISLLHGAAPDGDPPALVDYRGDERSEPGLAPVQALEGKEYRYQFLGCDELVPLTTNRPEVFSPDDQTGVTGRFRPGLRTGTIPVEVRCDGGVVGTFSIEVRSRKFEYLEHYRWMLRDLAEIFGEILMERFATAEQRFAIDHERDAITLYQRFVFLQSLLMDGELEGALHQIAAHPHVEWKTDSEQRRVGRGSRPSSSLAREMTRPGPRIDWPGGSLPSLPRECSTGISSPFTDNDVNRFVRFALERWRAVVSQIRDAVSRLGESNPILRGLEESEALVHRIDGWLAMEPIRSAGRLTHFPGANQVLQKKSGYRTVLKAYVEFELASKLSWDAQDVFGGGKRDVARLYEYWVFVQLVKIVADVCKGSIDLESLFSVQDSGLSVSLREGTSRVFHGRALASGGRRMMLELHFNRRFKPGDGSWTKSLRPDSSLRIQPEDSPEKYEEIWLHFDAKYRLDKVTDVFPEDLEFADVEGVPVDDLILGGAKGEDLLKMHAYRDAIRQSAGAYVLYPGHQATPIREFQEVLPGLGAFPLFPTQPGSTGGAGHLRKFVEDVLNHAASQVTQHERHLYWTASSFDENSPYGSLPLPPAPFLPAPPADTLVLIGYVKSQEHLNWILEEKAYNLRSDSERNGSVGLGSKELAADILLLWGPSISFPHAFRISGDPRIWTAGDLKRSGYSSPRGSNYFVFPVERLEIARWTPFLAPSLVEGVLSQMKHDTIHAPRVMNWNRLCRLLAVQIG